MLHMAAQTGADHFLGWQQGQACDQHDAAPCYGAKNAKRRPIKRHVNSTSRFAPPSMPAI